MNSCKSTVWDQSCTVTFFRAPRHDLSFSVSNYCRTTGRPYAKVMDVVYECVLTVGILIGGLPLATVVAAVLVGYAVSIAERVCLDYMCARRVCLQQLITRARLLGL
jgi:uncharacterized membrane protein YczE